MSEIIKRQIPSRTIALSLIEIFKFILLPDKITKSSFFISSDIPNCFKPL